MLKAGDYVRVLDASHSMELVDGRWTGTYGSQSGWSLEVWVVLAIGGNLPTCYSLFTMEGTIPNDVLLAHPYESNRLLATRERFVQRVDLLGRELQGDSVEQRVISLQNEVGALRARVAKMNANLESIRKCWIPSVD